MGRVVTPKFRVELEVPGFRLTPWCWNSGFGRACAPALSKLVRELNQSCELGGSNHPSMPGARVRRAWLVRQADNMVVADYVRDRGSWKVNPYEFVAGGPLPDWS